MPRKRDRIILLGELAGTLPGLAGRRRVMSAQTRHHFTTLRQVNQLIEAGEGEPELGFMARLLALCSLPRTNPKQRVQYIRRNGPYKLIMQAGGDPARLPFGNLPRLLLALGEEFFNEIIAHPIPFDLHTIKALKRSSLGLDLYFWLVYRTFTLKRPLCLSWKQLYRQFGADPAKSSKNTTVQHFRQDCLRELKKNKRAWPDLHYQTVTGGLVVSPSPPRIPPAQLRLISE